MKRYTEEEILEVMDQIAPGRLKDVIKQLLDERRWQPIETAPKDGAEFQAWMINESGDGFWEPRCRLDENGRFGAWGRVDYDEDGWDYGLNHLTATHWMPKPPPPEGKP